MPDTPPLVSTPAAWPSSEKPLIGKYVRLEGLCREHIPSLFYNLGLPHDKSVFDWLPWNDPTITENDLWELFDRLRKNRNFVIYAIKADPEHLNPPGEMVVSQCQVFGTIGYLDVNPQHRSLEIGAVLFGKALRRSVAATEAHYLIVRNACELENSLSYRRVAWKCNPLNTASRRAADRMGYVYEGTMRKNRITRGRSGDSDLLSIIDDEWPIVKDALEAWLEASNFDEQGRQIRSLESIRAKIKNETLD